MSSQDGPQAVRPRERFRTRQTEPAQTGGVVDRRMAFFLTIANSTMMPSIEKMLRSPVITR
jgi:hypothetical protein